MNSRIIPIIILVLVLVVAIYIGSLIGTEDYGSISMYFLLLCVIWFVVTGWKMTWQIVAIFSFSGIAMYQGFNIQGNHLFALMVVFGSFIGLYRRQNMTIPMVFRLAKLQQMKFFVCILLVYGAIHAVYNYMYPINELEYSVNNAMKAYFAVFASFVLMLWLASGPFAFVLGKTWIRSLCLIIGLSLIVNVIYMGSMIMLGYGEEHEYASHFENDIFSKFNIPILNIYLSPFNLRILSWQAIFMSLLFLLNRNLYKSLSILSRGILLICIPLSIFGAVLSAGRVALILCILFAFIALLKNGRMNLILSGMVFGLIFVIAINLFSSVINKAPTLVSRPFQLMMIDKGRAYQSITGSSETRDKAAEAGLIEWNSNDRIFWFGRSVYKHLGEDYYKILKNRVGEYEAFSEYSVRSATVHNLYGDLLIQYGLVGAIFYTLALLSCMAYCINLYRYCRKFDMPPVACELSFFCAASIPVMFVIQIKGGGYYDVLYPLLIGIIRVIVSREEQARNQLVLNNK